MNQNITESAKKLLACGLSVIPTRPDKTPAIPWKVYQENRMPIEAVENLFNQNSVSGIAIICGRVSANLEVLDVDCKNDKKGTLWQEFWKVVEDTIPGLLPRTVVTATVNGGYHVYYRCDVIEGNQKLAKNERNEVTIETRSEGGYVVAPPSPGYQLLQGNFDSIPVISEYERSVLLTVAKSFDEQPLPVNREMFLPASNNGLSPFDDYNQRADVVGLLEKHGWQRVKQQNERIHLRRSGKNDGISGNYHSIKRIFYPFTTSSDFEANRGYNPVGVYTILEADGDFSKASKQLYEDGFGDRRAESCKLQMTAKKKTVVPPLVPFPIEGWPTALQEIINTCSETFGTPKDYWAGSVLTASALAIGNKIELHTNYINQPVLWLVLVGEVSSGKSFPMDFCLSYFKKQDNESIRKYDELLSEFKLLSKMTAKERKAEGLYEKPVKPECFQYILNDYTPEALVEAHMVNNRGLLIERDELKGWIDDFGRYNKSGEQSNMLTSWSEIGITYNRKTSGILNILHPCIMVAGGMQPDLLHTLADDNRAENGFLSRLISIYPDNTDKGNYNTNVLNEKVKENWERYLSQLLTLKDQKLTLSKDAQQRYELWYNHNAELINKEESGYLKGVFGKLDIISLRLAIIVSGMNMVCGDLNWGEITDDEMKSALDMTEYFRATALKVYRKIFENNTNDALKKNEVIKYLFNEIGMKKVDISKVLETSRSQVDRVVT